jgi:glycosyltransferase involved in cell wall biosynthesis
VKILFLSWNYPPRIGGIEDVVANLFAGLRRATNDVRLLTAHAPEAPVEDGVLRAPRPGLPAFLLHALRRGWSTCRSFRPDVILCGSVVPAPVALLLSRAFRLPFVVLVYGSDLLFDRWAYQRVLRLVLPRADRLVAISAGTRRILEEGGYDTSRVEVVPPGVRLERFADRPRGAAASALELPPGRRVLLTVGRLVRRKGIAEFVERVMPRLAEADPSDSLAHHERLRAQIEARVEALGLHDHVRLLGMLPEDDLVGLYRLAELFVLPVLEVPGDVEGFGIVLLEAALAETAIVATRAGGIPEAVEDGRTGLLVEAGNHDEVSRAILRLLSDDDLRERLAKNGAARARAEFSWEVVAARHERVLVSVVDERRRSSRPPPREASRGRLKGG